MKDLTKIKISLPIAIVIASIVLGGFLLMVQVNKQRSIERQQETELTELKNKITELENKELEIIEKTVTVTNTPEDPILKIEKCKTRADNIAYTEAQQQYYEAANNAPDTETMAVYIEAASDPRPYKPYKEIYMIEYELCLNQ